MIKSISQRFPLLTTGLATALIPVAAAAAGDVALEELAGIEEALHCRTPHSLQAMPDVVALMARLEQGGVAVSQNKARAIDAYDLLPLTDQAYFHGHLVTGLVIGRKDGQSDEQAFAILLRARPGQSTEAALRRLFLESKSRGYWFVQERFRSPLQYRLYRRSPHKGLASLMKETKEGGILLGCFTGPAATMPE